MSGIPMFRQNTIMAGIEIAGLVLAAPAVIKKCLELGDGILKKIKDNKDSRSFAAKAIAKDLDPLETTLYGFYTEVGRTQLELDMEQAKHVLKDPAVSEESKKTLSDAFGMATRSLKKIDYDVGIMVEKTSALYLYSRSRIHAYGDMKNELTVLETKMSRFRNLIMALRQIQISESSLLLEDQDFQIIGTETDRMWINESTFVTKGRPARDTQQAKKGMGLFLFDAKPYVPSSKESLKKDLRFLSERLASKKTSSGILELVGFRDGGDNFQLVFKAPSSVQQLQTLQITLQRTQERLPSLNARLSLCCQLAEIVLHVHTLGLVHKNVRPDNILAVFHTEDLVFDSNCSPELSLIGWERARQVNDNHTNLEGETLWERSLYQHPERCSDQGKREVEEFCMGHDIYSLAVCMLEILTWQPLILSSELGGGAEVEPVVGRRLVEAFSELGLAASSEPRMKYESDGAWISQDAINVQKMQLQIASTDIPAIAGRKITDLVGRCLSCLDPGAMFAAKISFDDRNQKELSLDFIDSVLNDLRNVSSVI